MIRAFTKVCTRTGKSGKTRTGDWLEPSAAEEVTGQKKVAIVNRGILARPVTIPLARVAETEPKALSCSEVSQA